ncbi:unnamed protein product, partial [Didymodactylos carnosus]
ILKSIEFSSSSYRNDEQNNDQTVTIPKKSLEILLLEKNRALQNENTQVKVAHQDLESNNYHHCHHCSHCHNLPSAVVPSLVPPISISHSSLYLTPSSTSSDIRSSAATTTTTMYSSLDLSSFISKTKVISNESETSPIRTFNIDLSNMLCNNKDSKSNSESLFKKENESVISNTSALLSQKVCPLTNLTTSINDNITPTNIPLTTINSHNLNKLS